MRIGALFAGMGGLELGIMAALGGEVAWHSEIDPGACKVLAHRFPGVPNHGDITKVDWSAVEPVDVVCAGFPCQPVSTAGKRKGTDDERWLFDAIVRAIGGLDPQPRLLMLENVPGLLSANGGDAMARVVHGLASVGYVGRYRTFRASDVGACHRRERWLCAAWPAADPCYAAGHGQRSRPQLGQGNAAATDADDLGRERPGSARGRRGGPADGGRGDGGARECLSPISATVAASALPGNTAATDPMGGASATAPTSCAATGSEGLLPTPTSRDGKGHNQRGDTTCLTGALLPTPRAANGNGHGKSLSIEAQRLLATPTAACATGGPPQDSKGKRDLRLDIVAEWGQYADAIARWEALTRPAPAPTQPSKKGTPQLSPRFSEWMLGLPDGWVTDVPGLTRNDMLRILGNGVVPQQAAAALRMLLEASGVAA